MNPLLWIVGPFPAFYIAGAISVFLNQQAVLRYLGPGAPKLLAIVLTAGVLGPSLGQNALYFALMVGILAFANWGRFLLVAVPTAALSVLLPGNATVPFVAAILGLSAVTSTAGGELGEWFTATWGFTKQILPLLLYGNLVS